MNARLTFTRPNTLLGATTLAAWPSWACAAMTASAILTQSIGRVAADPLLSLSGGLYEVTSRLELPHLERWAIDKKTRICLFSHEEDDAIRCRYLVATTPSRNAPQQISRLITVRSSTTLSAPVAMPPKLMQFMKSARTDSQVE